MPESPTTMFQLSPRDVRYSLYRPDLVEAGATDGHPAVDGRPMRGLPQDNDDALSRRDMGLEFLDVTHRLQVRLLADAGKDGDNRDLEGTENAQGPVGREWSGGEERRVYRITNNGVVPVDPHLLVIATGLSYQVEMTNATGRTSTGDPYRRVFLPDGVLMPGQSLDVTMRFRRHRGSPPVTFTLTLLSGQGNP